MEVGQIARVGYWHYQSPSVAGIIRWRHDRLWGWVPTTASGRDWKRIETPSTEQVDAAVELWPSKHPKTFITKVPNEPIQP